MENIITELWYGNVRPWEQSNHGDEDFLKLSQFLVTHQHNLRDSLTEEQKKLLEKYEECCIELEGIEAKNAFTHGFCLGVKLLSAVMHTKTGE